MNDATQPPPLPHIQAYSRLLGLLAAVEMLPGMEDFGVNEKALFDEILLAWSLQQPVSVREAIHIERLGSPATLHKRLARLRVMGLVKAEGEKTDRRVKYLSPTEKGLAYAQKLGCACAESALGVS